MKVDWKVWQIVAPMGPLWATSVFSVRKVAPAGVWPYYAIYFYGHTMQYTSMAGHYVSDYYHKDGGKSCWSDETLKNSPLKLKWIT